MRLIESIWTKARSKIRTIVLPEGDEPRTVAAAAIRGEDSAVPEVGADEAVHAVADAEFSVLHAHELRAVGACLSHRRALAGREAGGRKHDADSGRHGV